MQDINVISHSMLVDRDEQGNAFTTSLVIADGTGNEHRAVLQLVKNNIKDFEEFGRVAFEMQPFKTAGGVQERKVALLNHEQATLLMTYMRNNDVVRDFKKRLVRAFSEMEKRLSVPALSGPELVARALIEAQNMLEEKDQQIKELAPRAGAWETFCESSGDMSVADTAKALNSRRGVDTGRDRLFKMMQELGWTTHCHGYWEPMQYAVERGYLAVKVNMPRWRPNGESFVPAPTVRVTPKGLDRLAESLPTRRVGGADSEQ